MLQSYRQAIGEFYGDRKAKRSNVLLMNHIDEGVLILKWRNASIDTQAAFMIHPIFQNDDDLGCQVYKNWINDFSPNVVLLALEYRHIANSYLPKHETRKITLSPLLDVNEMLVADKVQNCKDFILYNDRGDNHSSRLHSYFNEWLKALKVTDIQYHMYVEQLNVNSGNKPDKN